MHFSGTERIPATRDRVWRFLTNPDAVATCVPDVESIEASEPLRFKARVKAGIGPVRGKFGFDVTWQQLDEPSHAHMTAQGKTPGSAVTVDSTMDLTEAGDGETELAWNADVVVHGMIASVGARLLDGFAKKQTEQFFRCIRNQLSG